MLYVRSSLANDGVSSYSWETVRWGVRLYLLVDGGPSLASSLKEI